MIHDLVVNATFMAVVAILTTGRWTDDREATTVQVAPRFIAAELAAPGRPARSPAARP
jgi:hypothetical protein